MLVFVLSYYIVFYYYPLEACLLSNEREKGSRSRWEGRWGGTGRSRGRGNCSLNVLDEKRIYFQEVGGGGGEKK